MGEKYFWRNPLHITKNANRNQSLSLYTSYFISEVYYSFNDFSSDKTDNMNTYKWEGNADVKTYAQERTKIFIRVQITDAVF